MTISFTIEGITSKEMDDLVAELFDYIVGVESYDIVNYEITE